MANKPKPTPPRRGASRTASRTGASRHSSTPLPGWLWLLCGLAIGAFATLLVNLEPGNDAVKRTDETHTSAQPRSTTADGKEAPKPTYDFYTLLPESEVIVPPDSAASTPVPTPPPSKPETPKVAKPETLQVVTKPDTAKPETPKVVTKPEAPQVATKPDTTKPETPKVVTKPTPTAPIKQPETTAKTEAPLGKPSVSAQTTPKAEIPTPPPSVAKASSTQFFLQAGSFRKPEDADRVRAQIILLGQSVRVESGNVRGETWYRVLVGPFPDQPHLSQAQKQLAAGGYNNLLPQKRQQP